LPVRLADRLAGSLARSLLSASSLTKRTSADASQESGVLAYWVSDLTTVGGKLPTIDRFTDVADRKPSSVLALSYPFGKKPNLQLPALL